jgi:phage terminase small subunit
MIEMRYKTPIEIRQSQNIRVRTKLAEIPDAMRCRIPKAEWSDKPESFCRMQFIEETSLFIEQVYGFEPMSYQYLVVLLADQMQTYIDATIGFRESGSAIVVNDKPNMWLTMRSTATQNIIRLMREAGLTPASRLPSATPQTSVSCIHDLLPFPNNAKQGSI